VRILTLCSRIGRRHSKDVPPPTATIGRFARAKFSTRKARSSSCVVGENAGLLSDGSRVVKGGNFGRVFRSRARQ